MSLINEALKKAQKQRTGETPPLAAMPAIGGESATRIARRGQPAGLNTLLVRLGLGAVVLVVVIAGLVLFLRQPTPSVPVATAPRPAAPATTKLPLSAPAAAPAAATTTPPSAVPPAQFVLNIPAASAAKEPAVPVTTAKAEPSPAPPPVAPKVEPAVKTPAGPPKMDIKGITYIETLRVTGIRASATDSKVLMNDRVFRVGNIVEHSLGLKLTEITANSLTFEDEQGARYTRNF